jgi:hypothetical protein
MLKQIFYFSFFCNRSLFL